MWAPGNLEFVLKTLVKDCAAASRRWDILALPGVEITYAPVEDIDAMARDARALGAKVVNVHGETVVEPVEPGTNYAAVSSAQCRRPRASRPNHAGRGAHGGRARHLPGSVGAQGDTASPTGMWFAPPPPPGARIVLDSDAHEPDDLLTRDFALKVALGAGLDEDEANRLLESAPLELLKKVGVPYP